MLVLAVLSGCNYRVEKVSLQDERQTGERWYAWIDRTVLQPRCVSCHGGAKISMGIDLSSYRALMASNVVVPGQPDQSQLFQSVSEGKMPVGPPLTVSQVDRIRTWISVGAPGDELPPPPKPEPKFSWLDKNVFEPKCLKCHTGNNPKGDVDFTNYASLMASTGLTLTPIVAGEPGNSGVYDQVILELMPPGPNKLSNEIREALAEWIRRGALED